MGSDRRLPPKKTYMKPEIHPFEKENHLNQTLMTLGSILVFPECKLEIVGDWNPGKGGFSSQHLPVEEPRSENPNPETFHEIHGCLIGLFYHGLSQSLYKTG